MCGWVLGPRDDCSAFDNLLPKDIPLSALNREVGHAPLEPKFANGCLATVMFWECCFFPDAIGNTGDRLAAVLGEPLPENLRPQKTYQGHPQIIVPTVRSVLYQGETLHLKLVVLDRRPVTSMALLWRPLGKGEFQRVNVPHVARAVYRVESPSPGEDFEYRIEVTTASGTSVMWPATAPEINQTVLLLKD